MAQTGYSQGVAEVAPSGDIPNDYQSGRGADEAAFGGGIAQGAEKLGAGLTTSGKFFGKVVADNASNDFQDFATKLLHGDPNKQVPGPDGQMAPDTGYLGLKGRAALDQRPAVQEALDNRIKEIRATLDTPEQQQEFENFSRRYRTGTVEKVGSHADAQASSWYASVNTASGKLAMDHIANNFDNPKEVAAGAADLTAAYVRNAQIQGATPDSPQFKEAMAAARRDALQAQLNAMAVKDPSRALAVLDKNKDIAGVTYDNLAASFRTRAETQRGIDVGTQAIQKTYTTQPAPPSYQNVSLTEIGAPYGISGSYLQRTQQLETGSNPNQTSSTGAKGPFQFIDSTAKQYGVKDPFDYLQSADGAARLAADNKAELTNRLGRPPTDAELYIGHNQGSGGAAALLQYPTLSARDALMTLKKFRDNPAGAAFAIRVNGGNPDAPAAAFTGMLTTKFAGAPGMATASRRASALQAVLENPDINPQERAHAISYVNQQMAAQTVAMEQDAKAKKEASDQAMGGYVQRMLTGQNTANIVNEIANDPTLEPSVKWAMGQAAERRSGEDINSAAQSYGPGFWSAYKQVTAAPGDPSRIADPTQIMARAGPGGDLTMEGVQKLLQAQTQSTKSIDGASVNTAKVGLMNYAKSKLSFEQDTGPIKIRDPKGEQIFNSQFIPKFESAYDAWIKAGKSPWEFLNQENVDKLMGGMRNKAEMDAARIAATGEGGTEDKKVPPAPAGVEAKAWNRIITSPPSKPDGKPWSATAWATAIDRLRENADDPTFVNGFDAKFGPSGFTAKDILSRIPPKKKAPAAGGIAPAVEPPSGSIPEESLAQKLVRESKVDPALEPKRPGPTPAEYIQTVGIRG